MVYSISKADRRIVGEIHLAGSKSISNRALIIRALSGQDFSIAHLASARDTALLQELLGSEGPVLDAGAAGTTFRFLTAYLSTRPGTQVLTGTERMKQRPIGILVEALRSMGAQIRYLEAEGYPPLEIGPPARFGEEPVLHIAANTSSQYISALLMIAPGLPAGLRLHLDGRVVSRPYIEMTLNLMAYFGVKHRWDGQLIEVPPQAYTPRPFRVEADWSAASYYYAMAAFADEAQLQLNGLFADSLQGDAILARMMESFGIRTTFNENGILLEKTDARLPASFEWDFIRCPDLAQTLAVVCAGLGVEARFTGLETLRIKETDRIAALKAELAKLGAELSEPAAGSSDKAYYRISGRARLDGAPHFATYKDHRMAMAFAPLAMWGSIRIQDPMVVDKSYPDFWKDIRKLGFEAGNQGAELDS